MKKFDLTWGESVVVRQALADTLSEDYKHLDTSYKALSEMGYTNHYGDPILVELTKKVIKDQTGFQYRHVFLTNGAAGGITLSLRAYAQRNRRMLFANKAPFFPVYPSMFSSDGVDLTSFDLPGGIEWTKDELNGIFLIDSPSNPLSLINEGLDRAVLHGLPIIWDAVYHNKIYAPGVLDSPGKVADVMVGSYSKLLGINGVRIGWIATDDNLLAERLKMLLDAEYCGLSAPAMNLLTNVLQSMEWDVFEREAKKRLDYNREEWSKVTKFFGDTPVKEIGMFYYGPMDKSAKKIFERANVLWVPGGNCGDTDDFGRFNLAQDNYLIAEAIKSIQKADRLK